MERMPRAPARLGALLIATVAVLTLTGCPSGGTGTGGGYGLGDGVSVVAIR